MLVEASVTGLFKTILIIIGVIVLIRFLGQLFQAKNALVEEKRLQEAQRQAEKERLQKLKEFGKTRIMPSGQSKQQAEDVDYEEV